MGRRTSLHAGGKKGGRGESQSVLKSICVNEDLGCSASFRLSAGLESASQGMKSEESFQDRALRFQAEDWQLLTDRWGAVERRISKDDSKNSERRRIVHSPTPSDCSSSLFSTLDSASSFSSRSEASSCFVVKGDVSPSSVIPTHLSRPPMPAISLPPSSIPHSFQQGLSKGEEHGEEVNAPLSLRSSVDGSDSFLEFDFREGRLVDSHGVPLPGIECDGDTFECPAITTEELEVSSRRQPMPSTRFKSQSFRNLEEKEEDQGASGFATPHSVFFSTTTRSPESIFCSPEPRANLRPSLCSEGDAADLLTEEDGWDVRRYDSDPGACARCADALPKDAGFTVADAAPKAVRTKNAGAVCVTGRNLPLPHRFHWSRGSKHTQAAEDRLVAERVLLNGALDQASKYPQPASHTKRLSGSSPGMRRLANLATVKTCSSPRTHPSPVTRTASGMLVKLPKVLMHRGSPGPSASSSLRRTLYASFKNSRLSHAIHDSLHTTGLRGPRTEIPQQFGRASLSPVRSWMDPVKESRASILASWASVYGVESADSLPRTSSEFSTDLESEASGDSLRGSTTRVFHRRRENSGYLYHASSPGLAKPRLSKTSLKHSSSSPELRGRNPVAVLKTASCVPVGNWEKPAPSLSHRVHSFVSRAAASSQASRERTGLHGGQMQCAYRDGFPSYSLVMDNTAEMFVAKVQKVEPAEGNSDQLFIIYRWKGKTKSGWRSWGKKDKPVCEFVGKLRVSSTLCDEISCSGEVKYYVESECVFVDVADETPSMPHMFRTAKLLWDPSTPGRSPWVHYSGSPASSTYFSPEPPSSPTVDVSDSPSRFGTHSMPLRHSLNSDKQLWQLVKQIYIASPMHAKPEKRPRKSFQDMWSDSDGMSDDSDMRPSTSLQSHTELAGLVIRTPLEKDVAFLQGANLAPGEKSGWGLNFLKRRSIRPRTSDVVSDEDLCCAGSNVSREGDMCSECGYCYACGSDLSESRLQKSNSSSESERGQRRKLSELRKMEDNISDHAKISAGQLLVTCILPAGKHSLGSTGISGPQPLIQRWRSGGRCDCGNWDEGCGLTILGSKQQPLSADLHCNSQQSCKIFYQGKQDVLVMDLSQQEQEGWFSVNFQHPMSSVQAFATAVSVLRCREPFLSVAQKKTVDPKRKPPRIPHRTNRANPRASSQEDLSSSGGYLVNCPPDPPLSPRARS